MGRFRRVQKGPTKNEKKIRRREDASRDYAAPLERRFPGLKHLSVELVFTDARGTVMKEEALRLTPEDPCDLTFDCPGICGVGKFDLAARIERALTEAEISFEAAADCGSPRYGTVKEPCGSSLKCRVELSL